MRIVNNDFVPYLIDFLSPFIIVFGFYVILYGDISPGGGFQGGAILASIFILQYLSKPMTEMRIEQLQKIEKIFYLLIVTVPFFSIVTRQVIMTNFSLTTYPRLYLMIMNLLIGLKVCLGFIIIFYEFVSHERRWSL